MRKLERSTNTLQLNNAVTGQAKNYFEVEIMQNTIET